MHPRSDPLRAARRLAWLALLPITACFGAREEEVVEEPAPVVALENAEVEREGFRLLHPTTWTLDVVDPFHDPDHNLFFRGPGGGSLALMLLDQPAEPEMLVDEMVGQHGLRRTKESGFERWGRYEGHGVEVRGDTAEGTPGGMRVFAWSDDARSFLVAERYSEEGYQEARPGFEVIASSFRLLGEEPTAWPAVAPGTPSDREGERIIVREGFRVRFPADWRVDTEAHDYDPDRRFTLRGPIASAWTMLDVREGELDPEAFVASKRRGLAGLLDEVTSEREVDRWGLHSGAGIVLAGMRDGLAAELRVFCMVRDGRTLVATEFHFTEVGERVRPGFALIASSFELLR